MLNTKIVSSLEKIFVDESIDKYNALERVSALRGERLSMQLIYAYDRDDLHRTPLYHEPVLTGALAEYATVREIKQLPLTKYDGDENTPSLADYLRFPPGLFPDPLVPLIKGRVFGICDRLLDSLWIDIAIPEDMKPGEYTFEVLINNVNEIVSYARGEAETVSRASVVIEVIDAILPEQTMKHTEWFYCDCLAQYYNVPVWSERHWEIIENYARVAVKNGINMLLTPVFTPPLDTAIGGQRLTTQLVGIKKSANRYTFNWKLLDRWIEMCNRVGVKYLEISHLFTQWGATHAPKIMATEDGEYKQIFGWDTDAHGEEYKKFLHSFLKALLKHMKDRGDDKRCYFHISDEPRDVQIEDYKKSKKIVEGILKDYCIMDALSDVNFYKKGISKNPVPSVWHFMEFYKAGLKNPWTYYCGGGGGAKYSSRMLAKPSYNNRSLGMQMYKYGIEGFLHWGYNFYNTRQSLDAVDPMIDISGGKWVPAGDTCLVYPAQDGTAFESIRILTFNEGLQDMRAMQLCESLYSHDEVVGAIEEVLGDELTFTRCAHSSAEMHAVREKINEMIKAKV
jgi:hypothetical protein